MCMNSGQRETVMDLHSFFYEGGLELALDAAAYTISTEAIRRKSIERIDDRERRAEG